MIYTYSRYGEIREWEEINENMLKLRVNLNDDINVRSVGAGIDFDGGPLLLPGMELELGYKTYVIKKIRHRNVEEKMCEVILGVESLIAPI